MPSNGQEGHVYGGDDRLLQEHLACLTLVSALTLPEVQHPAHPASTLPLQSVFDGEACTEYVEHLSNQMRWGFVGDSLGITGAKCSKNPQL